jgi:hypothetical protein
MGGFVVQPEHTSKSPHCSFLNRGVIYKVTSRDSSVLLSLQSEGRDMLVKYPICDSNLPDYYCGE